jgi:serine/threonine-protein kinase RsbW
MATVSLDLPNHPLAAGLSRGAVRAVGETLATGDAALLGLLTNELVTNSIIHAPDSPRVLVAMMITDDRVRVEVTDLDGSEGPRLAPPSLTQTSGRGLYLVDALSHTWGIDRSDGTRVWFEILLGDPAEVP